MLCPTCPTLNTNTCRAPDFGTLLITGLITTLLDSQCELQTSPSYPPDANGNLYSSYDFIVVGAGSAGCTVASRLSENSKWKVLLLEAGGDPPLESEIPALSTLFWQRNPYNWNYTTEPQPESCKGSFGNRCFISRGKLLGGCSSVNLHIYQRGRREDYDQWAAEGAVGWDFEGVLPYFRKSEDTRDEAILALPEAQRYHRTGGELTTSPVEPPPFSAQLLEGARRSNYSYVVDFNRNGELGFGFNQLTTRNGTRCSSAKAFLSPARNRKNLHVARNCLVTKVLVNAANKKAYGVEFITNGKVRRVIATKEVILSAGVINSPQILLLSGIGPREQLQRVGISPVNSDIKTGERMRDHIIFFGLGYAVNKTKPDPNENNTALFQYLLTRQGPLAGIGISAVNGFIQTRFGKPLKDYPDIQVGYLLFREDNDETFRTLFELNDDSLRRLQTLTRTNDIIVVAIILLHPESTGRIELQSNDPRRPPRIFGNYLTRQRDVDSIVEAALTLVNVGQVTPGVEKVVQLPVEECADKEPLSAEYFRCAIPYTTTGLYHACGSCGMGPANAEWSVVDPRLRVKGVKNLRVIDASIFTSTVSGNTNAASIMVGEKGADIIKEDWS